MAIKIDLTEEPYFGIIRHWSLRRRAVKKSAITTDPVTDADIQGLAAKIVACCQRHHVLPPAAAPNLIGSVCASLRELMDSECLDGSRAVYARYRPSRRRSPRARAVCTITPHARRRLP